MAGAEPLLNTIPRSLTPRTIMMQRLPGRRNTCRTMITTVGILLMTTSGCSSRGDVVPVVMRDGEVIRTRVTKPAMKGKWPAVLMKGYGLRPDPGFVDHGYVWVSQGARTNATRFFRDGEDGFDTVEWIARQDWSNGQVAMYGRSYHAMTQWLTARLAPPHLTAIVPQHMNPDIFQLCYRNNGALNLAMTAPSRGIVSKEAGNRYGWEKALRFLPLIDLDRAVGGEENQLWNDYVTHSTFDEYWKAISIQEEDFRDIRIPVFNQGGWFDYYAGAALMSHQALRSFGATPELRVNIGASNHVGNPVGDRHGIDAGAADQISEAVRWLDHVLKGKDNGIQDEPPVRIFVMGVNRWRGESEWPLKRTRFTRYYLHSQDGGRIGDLTMQSPGEEPPSRYTYDPESPVPSIGGNHSADGRPWHLDAIPGVNLRPGSYDQRPLEDRDDVLIFSTPPLERDTEVTGPIELRLFAATDTRDTDWIARLLDVYPDGRSYNLTEGVLRARFRESIYKQPKLLEPGTVYEYTLTLLPTSNVFLKGHRIRIHITSSNWPLIDRNPNTGNDQGSDAETRVARQIVHHNFRYPSHVVLPIIP